MTNTIYHQIVLKMKKLLVLLLGIFTLTAVGCDDRPISFNDLPQQAQQFINQHFNTVGFLSARVDVGEYEVTLNDGTEIDFTRQGEWKKVDCHTTAVPAAIIPAGIKNYVAAQFPNNIIVKIDKDRNDYEVELNNDIDLKFDLKGNFLYAD